MSGLTQLSFKTHLYITLFVILITLPMIRRVIIVLEKLCLGSTVTIIVAIVLGKLCLQCIVATIGHCNAVQCDHPPSREAL